VSCISFSKIALVALLIATLMQSGKLATANEKNSSEKDDEVVFVPPKMGAPKERMGAGTRDYDADGENGALLLLAPEDGGLTTLASPPLIWHLEIGHRGDLAFALGPVGSPGDQVLISGPFPPGYYGLDLVRLEQQLETGRIYEWEVLLLDRNSDTVIARSTRLIERVSEEMGSGKPLADGLWFDALSPLVDISLSGRVRPINSEQFEQLLRSAGVGY
jgi:hypothetical protein